MAHIFWSLTAGKSKSNQIWGLPAPRPVAALVQKKSHETKVYMIGDVPYQSSWSRFSGGYRTCHSGWVRALIVSVYFLLSCPVTHPFGIFLAFLFIFLLQSSLHRGKQDRLFHPDLHTYISIILGFLHLDLLFNDTVLKDSVVTEKSQPTPSKKFMRPCSHLQLLVGHTQILSCLGFPPLVVPGLWCHKVFQLALSPSI